MRGVRSRISLLELLAINIRQLYNPGMKKAKHGGVRRGSGRPPHPTEKVRRNRVVVLVTDGEFEKLERLAEERALPLGTAAYEILQRALRRRK